MVPPRGIALLAGLLLTVPCALASPVPLGVAAGPLERALEVVAAAFRHQNDTELKALLTHMDVNDDDDKDDK